MISKYWAGGAILLSFFISSKFVGDFRVIRDFLFLGLSFGSVFLGVQRNRFSLPCFAIIGAAFYFTGNYMSIWGYQFPLFCAGIIAFHQLYNKPVDFETLNFTVSFLAVIATIWGILNYLHIEPYHFYKSPVIYNPQAIMSGPLLNHTLSSVYPAIALCLSSSWLLMLFFLIGLILYGSTMSILAGILGVIHFQLDSRGKFYKSFYFLGGALLTFLFGKTEFFSGQERLQVWKNILDWISPFKVNGLGYFHDNYMLHFKHTQWFLQEHNEYLAAYSSFGVYGLAVALILVFMVLRAPASKQKSASIAFLFICMGSFPLHISSLAIIGIMLITLTIQGDNHGLFKHKAARRISRYA